MKWVLVLDDVLWHKGRRPAVGEVIEMSEAAAAAAIESGLVCEHIESYPEEDPKEDPKSKGGKK